MKTATMRSLLGLACATLAVAAHADYRFTLSAQAGIIFQPLQFINIDETNGIKQYDGSLLNQTTTDLATVDMSLGFGLMKARIEADGNFANAYMLARTYDDITFHKPGGGPIQVRFNIPTDGITFVSGQAVAANARANLYLNGNNRIAYQHDYINNSGTFNDVTPIPVVMTVQDGETVNVSHRFELQANPFGDSDLVIDYSHTARATIEVLTGGASFTSSSGATYGAVPEPATLAVLGIGGIALFRRKKGGKRL
jgi:hypothetical protein